MAMIVTSKTGAVEYSKGANESVPVYQKYILAVNSLKVSKLAVARVMLIMELAVARVMLIMETVIFGVTTLLYLRFCEAVAHAKWDNNIILYFKGLTVAYKPSIWGILKIYY